MNALSKTGRILFALPFAAFGLNHLINGSSMGAYVPAFIPGGAFWVYVTGIIFLIVAVCIIIEKKVRVAGLVLGVVLLIFILTIHLPGLFNNFQASLTPFLKDTALMGASFYIAAHYYDAEMKVE